MMKEEELLKEAQENQRNKLKVQALLDKINEYEDKIAEYRVDITFLSNELEAARRREEKIAEEEAKEAESSE